MLSQYLLVYCRLVLSIESIPIIKKFQRKAENKREKAPRIQSWNDGFVIASGKKQAEESFSFNEIVSILCKYRSRDLNKCWGAQKKSHELSWHGAKNRLQHKMPG